MLDADDFEDLTTTQPLTHDQNKQAKLFMDVMQKKGYAHMEMANIIGRMGELLADRMTEEIKERAGNAGADVHGTS